MIQWGINNFAEIMKREPDSNSESYVRSVYRGCVRESTSKEGVKYPDRCDLKITKKQDGTPNMVLYENRSDQPARLESCQHLKNKIKKGQTIKVIVQPRIYFFSNNGFGMNLRVIKMISVFKKYTPRNGERPIREQPQFSREITNDESEFSNLRREENKMKPSETLIEKIDEEASANAKKRINEILSSEDW